MRGAGTHSSSCCCTGARRSFSSSARWRISALIPPARLGTMIVNGRTVAASRPMMVGFFAFHGGIFITAHLFFLCMLFSGAEFSRLNGVADFLRTFFIASGAWVPLLLASAGRRHRRADRCVPSRLRRCVRTTAARGARALRRPRPPATRSAALSAASICASSSCSSRSYSAPWRRSATAHWRRSSSSSHSRTLIDLVTRLSAISGVSPAPLLSASGTATD